MLERTVDYFQQVERAHGSCFEKFMHLKNTRNYSNYFRFLDQTENNFVSSSSGSAACFSCTGIYFTCNNISMTFI